MNLGEEAKKIAKTAKFRGLDVSVYEEDSELNVAVTARGSVNLPGDIDAIISKVVNSVVKGNSAQPLTSSEESNG